jgi:hypothetical protein
LAEPQARYSGLYWQSVQDFYSINIKYLVPQKKNSVVSVLFGGSWDSADLYSIERTTQWLLHVVQWFRIVLVNFVETGPKLVPVLFHHNWLSQV